jgi:hypothetical protein
MTRNPIVFQYAGWEQSSQRDDLMPLFRFTEMTTWRLYFDQALRNILW